MERDPGDVVDRYTISVLKGAEEEERRYFKEVTKLNKQYPQVDWGLELEKLQGVNRRIWKLEALIGEIALSIRLLNNQRVSIKNNINELTGNPTKEIKKDHASS